MPESPQRTETLSRAARMLGAGIAWAFVISFCSSVALAVVYALGGQPQVEGALLFGSLGGMGVGLVLWAHGLMPQGPDLEERAILLGDIREEERAEDAFAAGMEEIARRRFLGRLLGAAAAAFGFTLLFPIRSLGTRPGSALYKTAWRPGARAVTPDGNPVHVAGLSDNTFLTVFPEGHTDAADSQVVLIKLPQEAFRTLPGREDWSPERVVGFSKICTHAGCPVGLYEAQTADLYCPCHQSVFFVPDGAKPTSGPATRPLPQLPLEVDADGFIVAQSDFHEPVGPSFWRLGRRP